MGLQHSQGVRLAVKSSGFSLVVQAGWLHAPHQFSNFFRYWRAGLAASLLVTSHRTSPVLLRLNTKPYSMQN